MLVKGLLAALLASIIGFFYGFAFWGLSPVSQMAVKQLPDEKKVLEALRETKAEPGFYVAPYPPPDAATNAEFLDNHTRGPIMVASVKEGFIPMNPTEMLRGWLHFLIASVLGLLVFVLALPALDGFGKRVAFVTLLGFFASFTVDFSNNAWWHFPFMNAVYNLTYFTGWWLLTGLVFAWFFKSYRR
jgi:hypothetical protein